jgi:hypothetical protein
VNPYRSRACIQRLPLIENPQKVHHVRECRAGAYKTSCGILLETPQSGKITCLSCKRAIDAKDAKARAASLLKQSQTARKQYQAPTKPSKEAENGGLTSCDTQHHKL